MHITRLDRSAPGHYTLVETEVFAFMVDVFSKCYPGFRQWYYSKVLPGFNLGERAIYVAQNDGNIVGVSILKVAGLLTIPSKICSLYVLPELRGNGIGLKLMEHTLNEATWPARPVVLTMPEERLEQGTSTGTGKGNLLNFFTSYGFNLVRKDANRYRQGKDEYVFYMRPQPNVLALPFFTPLSVPTKALSLFQAGIIAPDGGSSFEPQKTCYSLASSSPPMGQSDIHNRVLLDSVTSNSRLVAPYCGGIAQGVINNPEQEALFIASR